MEKSRQYRKLNVLLILKPSLSGQKNPSRKQTKICTFSDFTEERSSCIVLATFLNTGKPQLGHPEAFPSPGKKGVSEEVLVGSPSTPKFKPCWFRIAEGAAVWGKWDDKNLLGLASSDG